MATPDLTDLVDKSVVEIKDIACVTLHDAGIEIGSVNPYIYVLDVAYRCIKYQDPESEPPRIGFGAQVTVTPAEMFYITQALGINNPDECCGKSFVVKPDWKASNPYFATRAYIDEIAQFVHILKVTRRLNGYRVLASYTSFDELIQMNFVNRRLYLFLYMVCDLFSLPTQVSSVAMTEDEYKHLALRLWQDEESPELAGISFAVDPKWNAVSPEDAINGLLGKEKE